MTNQTPDATYPKDMEPVTLTTRTIGLQESLMCHLTNNFDPTPEKAPKICRHLCVEISWGNSENDVKAYRLLHGTIPENTEFKATFKFTAMQFEPNQWKWAISNQETIGRLRDFLTALRRTNLYLPDEAIPKNTSSKTAYALHNPANV